MVLLLLVCFDDIYIVTQKNSKPMEQLSEQHGQCKGPEVCLHG